MYAEPLSQAFIRFASRCLPLATSRRLAGPVGEYFIFTLAAQLLSLPVTLYHFRRFSLVAWIANPVILPAWVFMVIFLFFMVCNGFADLNDNGSIEFTMDGERLWVGVQRR